MVLLSETVKLLGVTLDKSLTFHKHVNQVSQSCYYHMKALRHIRHCLDDQTASLIAHALISSRLGYANSILLGSPNYVINKLQRIQNSLARIVHQSDDQAHAEPLLQQLHWLPVQSRIRFKLATIIYKALSINSRNILLHLSTATNQSVLFAPLTNTTPSRLNVPPTLVLAHSVALLLPFGTQFLSISAHCKPLMPSNAA